MSAAPSAVGAVLMAMLQLSVPLPTTVRAARRGHTVLRERNHGVECGHRAYGVQLHRPACRTVETSTNGRPCVHWVGRLSDTTIKTIC